MQKGSVAGAVFMLFIWGVTTLALAVSFIGIIPLIIASEDKDGWFSVPKKCADVLKRN